MIVLSTNTNLLGTLLLLEHLLLLGNNLGFVLQAERERQRDQER